MAHAFLRTLLTYVEVVRPALTGPGFQNALVMFVGWVMTSGRAITHALVVTDVARRRHHERFYRFFSRGSWSPDAIGRLVFDLVLAWVPSDTAIDIVLDDTMTSRKGPHVFGLGCHLDPVRSTKRVRVFCFGHVWVVLSVVVQLPFARRAWAIPVLFRLYRNEKECRGKGAPYRKKTELARELVDTVAQWANERQLRLSVDNAYCNDTVLRALPENLTVYGSIRPDAVLTALPRARRAGDRGRRPVRGRVLPKPLALARNSRRPWLTCIVHVYGQRRTIYYKTIEAQWYRGTGARLTRIVIVRVDKGSIECRVFLCTDPDQTPTAILESYARRWATEVMFRDLKQHLAFGRAAVRKQAAVERTAPFTGYIYALLVLWFAEGVHKTPLAAPPIRPWYRHKASVSFADIVRTAQRVLAPLDVLDPDRSIGNLRERRAPTRTASRRRRRRPDTTPTAVP